jgi:16S rRNA (cytidine1402-2'-O)-methyltransferase
MGTLYMVGTPIGNLEDVTARALETLRSVALIVAEDTRTTRKLLARYNIHTPTTGFSPRDFRAKLRSVVERLATGDVAFVSEAGTPGISDPGVELAAAASAAGHQVTPIPGASAVTAALSVAGFPAQQYLFLGFLPTKTAGRKALLRDATSLPYTLVVMESPHRLRATLQDMADVLGDRRLAACRELTKLHEEVFRGTVLEALAHFSEPRGEFTLVVEGAPLASPPPISSPGDVHEMLTSLRAKGATARDAVAEVAHATGMPKREVYRLWLALPPHPSSTNPVAPPSALRNSGQALSPSLGAERGNPGRR